MEMDEWKSAGDLYLQNRQCPNQHTYEYYWKLVSNPGELRLANRISWQAIA